MRINNKPAIATNQEEREEKEEAEKEEKEENCKENYTSVIKLSTMINSGSLQIRQPFFHAFHVALISSCALKCY